MGCPTQCILGQNLTFTIQARAATGAPVAATGAVSYSAYEDETATAIVTGSMTQLASQTGFYSEQIECTTDNGFERYKSYTIRITATVSSVSVAKTYTFLCLGTEDTVTATTGALTSTANFKSYAGITSTDDDTLIGYLVSRATAEIEKYCKRTLRSATHRELYSGCGDGIVVLKNYPVIAISMFSKSITDSFGIKNTDSNAYRASVKVVDASGAASALTCTIYGGANAGSDELTISSYATNTLLMAAITALGKGWTVLTGQYDSWDPAELLPITELECLDSYVYPPIPEDNENDYRTDYDTGVIYPNTATSTGESNIVVKYTAGYATTPADLEQACIDLVKYYYDARQKDFSVNSKKLGDYSFTLKAESIPDDIKVRLDAYKRYIV